jgi:hypothetical protein
MNENTLTHFTMFRSVISQFRSDLGETFFKKYICTRIEKCFLGDLSVIEKNIFFSITIWLKKTIFFA